MISDEIVGDPCMLGLDGMQGANIVLALGTSGRLGRIITNSPDVEDAIEELLADSRIGRFVHEMTEDPEVTYYVWETDRLRRNGGGITTHCSPGRFDIWVDINYHRSREGERCTNPRGSGSLRSLTAHELGHAWAWRHYGYDDNCDNNARGNLTAVAWEDTQLPVNAQRVAHTRPGCRCGY